MVEALANQAQMARGPRLVGDFQPAYSLEQRAAGMQGQGRVSIIVTAEGRVDEASIRYSNAPPELDASALAAARLLKFTPAVDKAGKAIAVPALLPFSFEAASGHPMYAVRVEPVFSDAARGRSSFRLGFTAIRTDRIEEGLRRLGQILAKS